MCATTRSHLDLLFSFSFTHYTAPHIHHTHSLYGTIHHALYNTWYFVRTDATQYRNPIGSSQLNTCHDYLAAAPLTLEEVAGSAFVFHES